MMSLMMIKICNSQTNQILNYLKKGNSITTFEATNLFQITCLAERIRDLREKGYVINSLIIKDDISGKRYARYSLISLN